MTIDVYEAAQGMTTQLEEDCTRHAGDAMLVLTLSPIWGEGASIAAAQPELTAVRF